MSASVCGITTACPLRSPLLSTSTQTSPTSSRSAAPRASVGALDWHHGSAQASSDLATLVATLRNDGRSSIGASRQTRSRAARSDSSTISNLRHRFCCRSRFAANASTARRGSWIHCRPDRTERRRRSRTRRLCGDRHLERAIQRVAAAFGCGPPHAGLEHAVRALSLRWRAVVQRTVRPRRPDYRAADPLGEPANRSRRAGVPCRDSGRCGERRAGCGTRQDSARNPQQRDGAAGRGAVRTVLWQRRFDTAVRDSGRRLYRPCRRP